MAQLQAHEKQFNPEHVEPTSEWVDRYLTALFKEVDSARGTILVATHNAKVCGFAAAYVELEPETQMEYFYISDLAVDKALRGQGIGTALIQAMEATARAQGYKRMVIGVLADNVRAHKLYQALGFRNYGIDLLKKL